MMTNGIIQAFPTHQLAERPIPNEVNTTAIATGLKICFLPIAKIYFDATPHTAAHPKKTMPDLALIGVIISARISTVIYTDSKFVGALNTQAKPDP